MVHRGGAKNEVKQRVREGWSRGKEGIMRVAEEGVDHKTPGMDQRSQKTPSGGSGEGVGD